MPSLVLESSGRPGLLSSPDIYVTVLVWAPPLRGSCCSGARPSISEPEILISVTVELIWTSSGTWTVWSRTPPFLVVPGK